MLPVNTDLFYILTYGIFSLCLINVKEKSHPFDKIYLLYYNIMYDKE